MFKHAVTEFDANIDEYMEKSKPQIFKIDYVHLNATFLVHCRTETSPRILNEK